MKKILIFEKRKKARELHGMGWSIRKISKHIIAGRNNISKWIKTEDGQISTDRRGWKKGKPRKYKAEQKEKIIRIRKGLEKENSFFIGAKIVKKNYENQTNEKVSQSFVDRVLREAGMVKSPAKKRKGLSRYMKYPKRTLDRLGKSMMSIDFIGPKYLKGSDNRINFLSCKYIRPQKEGMTRRIEGQTAEQAIKVLKDVWKDHPIPDVLKIDNDSAFGANLSHEKCVGKLAFFLLNLGVSPLYVAPRSPWNNGEVEGFNSIFSKKFWNRMQFTDEDEIDIRIKDFNVAYEKYSELVLNNPPVINPRFIDEFSGTDTGNKSIRNFRAGRIYFLRIVRRKSEKGSDDECGFINILKTEIRLPKDLINLFVFCTLELKAKKLTISVELDDGYLKEVKTADFAVKNIED